MQVVKNQEDEILTRIETYVNDRKSQVEDQLQVLRMQREEMDGLRYEGELLVRNNHVAQKAEEGYGEQVKGSSRSKCKQA